MGDSVGVCPSNSTWLMICMSGYSDPPQYWPLKSSRSRVQIITPLKEFAFNQLTYIVLRISTLKQLYPEVFIFNTFKRYIYKIIALSSASRRSHFVSKSLYRNRMTVNILTSNLPPDLDYENVDVIIRRSRPGYSCDF